jgi:hypothetical protein
MFCDVRALRKQTTKPVKMWVETLVKEEQLGE